MEKYFYIGCRMQQAVTTTTGGLRNRQVTRWNSTVYNTAEDAANACAKMMPKYLGVAFFVQGFDKPLLIVDGESKGFAQ